MARDDETPAELARFLDSLTAEQRDGLVSALRDPRTFLAEDFDDVIAILRGMSS